MNIKLKLFFVMIKSFPVINKDKNNFFSLLFFYKLSKK